MNRLTAYGLGSLLVLVATVPHVLVSDAMASHKSNPQTPEIVLTQYLKAIYSRDAAMAYGMLATADRQMKTFEDYSQEIAAFDGRALTLARVLAENIFFSNFQVDISGTRAEVIFDVEMPNANDVIIDDIVFGFERNRLARLSSAQFDSLIVELAKQGQSGQLPVMRSRGENWNMVLENGKWFVFQNWAKAVQVNFEAITLENLGWEFTPLRDHVMAKHGETLQMKYRAENVGSTETTGKARHIIGPGKDSEFLEIVACFCFIQQTLSPGEVVELPLMFRVNYDAPDQIDSFTVRYEFYPLDRFPGDDQLAQQAQH